MENTKIMQYSVFVGIIILCILGITNFFKASDNLKESKKIIDNVLNEVKESKELLKNQALTIDDLQKLNRKLSIKVNQVDSTNNLIKRSLDANFKKTKTTIASIKNTIDSIEPVIIH